MHRKPKNIAVILNGSGHRDGSEIHEAVLTLLGIEEAGGSWDCLALDHAQARVINHVSGETAPGERRNMLTESARIARGRIQPLENAAPEKFDAVILPGGNGTAANLCNFASAGVAMEVESHLASFLTQFHAAGKPIGAICISPVILAKIFGQQGVQLTLGSIDNPAAKAAASWGAKLQHATASDCIVDEDLKIVTTPAYMCETSLADVAIGIRMLTKTIVAMA